MEAIGIVFMLLVVSPITIIILISIIMVLRRYSIGFFILLLFLAYLKIEYIEYKIRNKSIERFGVEPRYIKINFNKFWNSYGTLHATVCKDGREYYWSFGENDFIFYYDCEERKNGKKPTPESLEKLFNKYIFKEDKIK